MGSIPIERVYSDPTPGTYRILVDRIWPRGIAKDSGKVDVWVKDVAPSTELRHWYGHDEAKAEEFARRFRTELDDNPEAVQHLRRLIRDHAHPVLVYAAKSEHSNASVLQAYLDE